MMFFRNKFSTFSSCFVSTIHSLVNDASIVEVKGTKTKELLNYHAVISDGMSRNFAIPHRNDNPFAKMFESLWVFAGRNDIELLKWFLPRAGDFSDDGHTWRAGYGPRLRSMTQCGATYIPDYGFGDDKIDQLQNIYDALKADPFTRQAVASIWSPADDWVKSKDIPCNNWLHFIQRNGALHLNVSVRSNDVWWGFSGINFYEWSFMLQIMAHCLDMAVGSISWNVTSMHMYERHWAQAEKMLDCAQDYSRDALGQFPKLAVEPYLNSIEDCTDMAHEVIGSLEYQVNSSAKWHGSTGTTPHLFGNVYIWLGLYIALEKTKRGELDEGDLVMMFDNSLPTLPESDQYAACALYLNRQLPKTNLSRKADLLYTVNSTHPDVYDFVKDVLMATT